MKYYQIENLVFFPISTNSIFCSKTTKQKYIAGTLYGGVFVDSIHTEEEIRATYPDIKEVDITSKNK